jgi:hypothetical protein
MILSGGNRWASEEREGANLAAHLDGSGGNASTSTRSGPAGPCRRSGARGVGEVPSADWVGHEALPALLLYFLSRRSFES